MQVVFSCSCVTSVYLYPHCGNTSHTCARLCTVHWYWKHRRHWTQNDSTGNSQWSGGV